MEINEQLFETFKKRYDDVHPLVFHRSVEHAKSPGDLFDILEDLPNCPLAWSNEDHCWKTVSQFSS